MERREVVWPKRTERVHRSMAEKRQIVELVLQPGVSVERGACSAGRRCKREPGLQVVTRVSQRPVGGSQRVHNIVVAGGGSRN
jgi:hypothetical protein